MTKQSKISQSWIATPREARLAMTLFLTPFRHFFFATLVTLATAAKQPCHFLRGSARDDPFFINRGNQSTNQRIHCE